MSEDGECGLFLCKLLALILVQRKRLQLMNLEVLPSMPRLIEMDMLLAHSADFDKTCSRART
jgi:hypothetical protein